MDWDQLSAIIWLRWRLTRNQFARAGALNAVLSVIGMVLAILVIIGSAVGGLLGGAWGMSHASPLAVLGVWDAIALVFLFTWMLGVVMEIQRSESIDLTRLLHLPVSLRGVFVMNYLASLLTFSILIFLPGTMGLCLGLLWASGFRMLLLVPLVLGFLFMVTAWTYCLRGWLVTVMINPRRRRNVVICMVMTMALLGQAPNIYFNVFVRHQLKKQAQTEKELRSAAKNNVATSPALSSVEKSSESNHAIPSAWVAMQSYIPFLWLPRGAMALAEEDAWPAILGSAGAFLLGAAGLAAAYRSTIRFYQGQEKAGAVKQPIPAQGRVSIRNNFLEKRVPFVADDVAALTLAFFRSLSRAPEVKMALFSSVIMIVALVPIMFLSSFKLAGETAQLFAATGVIAFTFFGMVQQIFNHFGTDRDGFRALVLSPARRQDILFAKNLALAPVAAMLGICFLGLLWWVGHLRLLLILAALCQLAATYLLLSIAGNFISEPV
jgi:ABC-2 type transport system permease protein